MKALVWDIETSLQPVTVFRLAHNDWIDPSALLGERAMICAAWKWLDEDEVHSSSILDTPTRFKKDPHDDRTVVAALHKVLAQADLLIHHNGDAFDLRYLNTRILAHQLPPLPPIPTIDTYKLAKQKFLFNSNKLDYIGQFLGVGKKQRTSPDLWMRAFKGDAEAIAEMRTYNEQDVRLCEQVYKTLQAYAPQRLHTEGCSRCGSLARQARGLSHTLTKTYQRFQCQGCGGWSRALVAEKGQSSCQRPL